ncbi:MAG: hypothetical protein H7281_12350 [Bacteriovorax sp.]|nr:hypothetical protein [Bacteriovorax sp.]
MQNINYEQIIAVLGMCVWFVFPFGMFISAVKQDREALPPPQSHPKHVDEHLKIFDHKSLIYNDDEAEDNEIPENDIAENIEQSSHDEDFIHPHIGIGSSHSHHIH